MVFEKHYIALFLHKNVIYIYTIDAILKLMIKT